VTRIVVDPTRQLGSVDRNVFGGFVEHLGRCIYGGLYEEGSPLADARGFRGDVLSLLRELRMGVLRWPGGNFVSNYHWADGIGPKDDRPRRPGAARSPTGSVPTAARPGGRGHRTQHGNTELRGARSSSASVPKI
jgi:alpha-L-arabinofuranosidase